MGSPRTASCVTADFPVLFERIVALPKLLGSPEVQSIATFIYSVISVLSIPLLQ
jgi:hypothetical protein